MSIDLNNAGVEYFESERRKSTNNTNGSVELPYKYYKINQNPALSTVSTYQVRKVTGAISPRVELNYNDLNNKNAKMIYRGIMSKQNYLSTLSAL
jgi:hypothetical protein